MKERMLGGHVLGWLLNSFLGNPRYYTSQYQSWEMSEGLARGFRFEEKASPCGPFGC